MSSDTGRELIRDMERSSFGEIMSALLSSREQIEMAVFFDKEGETIDYYSYQDPFVTRLAAALHGVIFASVRARVKWLDFGNVEMLEFCASRFDSVTVPVGQEFFLTVFVSHGKVDAALYDLMAQVVIMLREEMGF